MTKPKPASELRPKKLQVTEMTAGQLADEHRGYTFAKNRAKDRLKEIEAELDRRGLFCAQGQQAFVTRQLADIGLVDLKRLRADLGDGIWIEYRIPGSEEFWRSGTLKKDQTG
ncbi:hypothetical protein [Beijerinckia sp. L45]|uniref:hypothetical protein n=1 Tax=Beijerinckia sp. L45 TaxID=1641855 RepID=UPI00131DAA5E|nr:hypothetical protein [Beijerinckia sp. L45]